jgi:hypothetical protein
VTDSARQRGRGQGQRLLYWFRTPPGVRVGRAPIDEEAIRLLEQHNPEVQFDWARLLKEALQEPGARRDRERDRDPRDRDRRERRDLRDQHPPRPRPLDTTAAAVPPAPPPIVREATAEVADERAAAHADRMLRQSLDAEEPDEPVEPRELESLAVAHGEPLAADHGEYVEYAEASFAPPAHSEPSEPASAASARLGPDGVMRLRARYVQIVARIAEKPMDDDARAELNARIQRLNPDAWLTADEVAAALEQYESVFESLRAEVGYHPPRRRRHVRPVRNDA